jgi:tetratricopeptide (TPR) repeat protein
MKINKRTGFVETHNNASHANYNFYSVKTHYYGALREIWLLSFVVLLFSCSSSETDILSIKKLIEEGDISQAEQQIHLVLGQDSSNVELNILYADLLLKKGEYKNAYHFLNRARNFDSTNVEVNLKLSEFHLYLGQFEKSIASANDVLKKQRNSAKAYFLKGMSYKEFGDTAKAFSNFQTAVEQDANYYEAFVQLGILASAMHDSTSVQYFDNALLLKPSSSEAFFNKAYFYQKHGAPNKAINTYARITPGTSFYGRAVYNSGVLFFEQGKLDKAKQMFDIAVQYNNAKAHYMLGLISELKGDVVSARMSFEKCLTIDSHFEKAKQKLIRLRY